MALTQRPSRREDHLATFVSLKAEARQSRRGEVPGRSIGGAIPGAGHGGGTVRTESLAGASAFPTSTPRAQREEQHSSLCADELP